MGIANNYKDIIYTSGITSQSLKSMFMFCIFNHVRQHKKNDMLSFRLKN